MDTHEIITFIASVSGSGVLVFLFRNWISERLKDSIQHEYNEKLESYKAVLKSHYDEKLETHKAQLNSQSQTELARFQSQLAIAAAERNVQYSRVFEKTADIIAETYGKLLAMKNAADDYTQLMGTPSDSARQKIVEAFREKERDLMEYFLPRKIYIPKETAEKIWIFSNAVNYATMQFTMAMAAARSQVREPDSYGKLFNNFIKTSDELPKLLEALENDFQHLLGFRIEQKSAIKPSEAT